MFKRWVLTPLAVLLMLFGALLAVSGGALVAVFSSGQTVRSGSQPLSTTTHALVSPVASVQNARGVRTRIGQPSLDLSVLPSGQGSPVFVGIGRTADVDRYLAGSSVAVVTDLRLDPYGMTTRTHPGLATPKPPAAEHFWLASARSGTDPAHLTWPVRSGGYRIVVMNADGSADVNATAEVAVTIPRALRISAGILLIGLFIIALGVFTLALAVRPGRPRSAPRYRPISRPRPT